MVTHSRNGSNSDSQEPRHILVVCRSEMVTSSLTELLAQSGYGVTGVVSTDRGRKIIEARPIALVVLAARGDTGDVELVRTARRRDVPTIVVALSPRKPANLIVDGQQVIGASGGALMATVQATIGGPVDAGPTDPWPRAA
jgi:DNA-binding NarL/FixJ family response regulator